MPSLVCTTIWYKPTQEIRNQLPKEMISLDENKKKFALWIHPSSLEKVERLYQLDNCRSKSEFIEKAILIVGIIYFAFIGYKFLPNKEGSDEGIFDESKDFSHVPKWKQYLSLVILLLTLVGMIFEEQLGTLLVIG